MSSLRRQEQSVEEFETLTREFAAPLYRYALRSTGNPSQAEDLVQETYLKAFRSFDRFERGTNCKAWLFRILINTLIDERRKSGEADPYDDEFLERQAHPDPPEELPAHAQDPSRLVEYLRLVDEVRQAMETLPRECREALQLCCVEGFSYREAAAACDVPIGTIMSRLFRGRQLLRNQLRERAEERALTAQKRQSEDSTKVVRLPSRGKGEERAEGRRKKWNASE